MAKSRSWSVKGIDGETRDLARDAAQVAGMTIGAWIDQAILKAKQGALPGIAIGEAGAPQNLPSAPGSMQPPVPEKPAPARQYENRTGQPPGPIASEPEAAPADRPETHAADSVPEPASDPAVNSLRELVADPRERSGINVETNDGPAEGSRREARPLAVPVARRSPTRIAILGVFFLAVLAGGGWLFAEFSKTGTPPNPRVADSTRPSATPLAGESSRTGTPTPGAPASPLPNEVRTGIEMANAGDAKAQHDLGVLYLAGRFVRKDSTEAAKWFERAAVQGLANAQFNLGVLYERGEGVAQNDQLAFFWYQSAAEQGMARAQHNLATAYAQGKGTVKSYPKAVDWFTKSANAGLAASQFSLAAIYERGLATGEPDLAQARSWYEKAMAQGDAQATERLAAIDARLAAATPAVTVQTPAGASAPASAAPEPVGRAEIREIQRLLARMNFEPGPADGQMGKRTADAIRLYQQFAGIEVDGVPTRELLEEMRLVSGSMPRDG